MTNSQRLWLSRLFVLLFLIITPLTLAYAAGYRINWRYFKLEKTGLLEIKTVPDGAQVNIDELKAWLSRPKNLTTTLKLKNLRPDDYTINISLTGYHNWRKTLTVRPAETTFAKNIRLFKQTSPQLLEAIATSTIPSQSIWPENNKFNLDTKHTTTTTIDELLIKKDSATSWLNHKSVDLACLLPDKKVAYVTQFELWLADPANQTSTLLGRFSQPIKQLICLPDTANYLIYGHNDSWQLIELDDRQGRNTWKLTDLKQLGPAAINKKADRLYFYGQVGSNAGLFGLDL